MNERDAMARAVELAWRGWGRVQPNPLVGAVVLAAGEVVGEGWHAEYGQAHAEALALTAAGDRARGATVVCTLEPCDHQGKQPPCTGALLAAGVRRVVAAVADPSPVAGGGAARLRAAGVEVELGLLADEAAAQNAIFLHAQREGSRPYVALKLATTIDGRIADANGHSRWLSAQPARDFVQWLRAGYDAVAVGGVTARADDPSLTVRGPLVPRIPPRRVVFAADGDVPPSLRLVRTARETPTTLVVSALATPERLTPLQAAGVGIVRARGLVEALRALREDGVTSLLVEGGGRLAGALLAEGLVDRYYWVQTPLWLGVGAVPAVAGLPTTPLDQADRWRVTERRALGDDTLLVLDRP
ncbi:MAG TPA: bifunctional diaminohydroxyphosphoribosylaminopyrimidine deaminase/5-amino-6-(5-phosphoribosylamino)uracil reductase RibD [Gemmatimonadales bacterium]|nr:bifunctional diaminohydroxyphosphoribosylaminopyrimidine deaminase/5-amino-6-(5-phosphoribosylamino)uracil reductase RibD [Gemmatimonadales bacterium]